MSDGSRGTSTLVTGREESQGRVQGSEIKWLYKTLSPARQNSKGDRPGVARKGDVGGAGAEIKIETDKEKVTTEPNRFAGGGAESGVADLGAHC